MACALGPTTLTRAEGCFPEATALQVATHCHAADAVSASPRMVFGERRGPGQSRQAVALDPWQVGQWRLRQEWGTEC